MRIFTLLIVIYALFIALHSAYIVLTTEYKIIYNLQTVEHADIVSEIEYTAPNPCNLSAVICESEKKESTHDVISRISLEESFIKWEIVAGICELESECGRGLMIGDGGKSHGYYHIYSPNVCEENGNAPYCISSADRYDLEKATRWTVQRLMRHAHLGEHEMIRSHNGLVSNHHNDWYVEMVIQRVKDRVIS